MATNTLDLGYRVRQVKVFTVKKHIRLLLHNIYIYN